MLTPRRIPAPAALRSVVRGFSERRMTLTGEGMSVRLPARPDLFIEIYLGEAYRIAANGGVAAPTPSDVMIVSPHIRRRVTLHLGGEIQVFHVSLQPTALHRLFGVDAAELADDAVEARLVFGAGYDRLRDAVLAAPDFAGRVAAAQGWFASRLDEARADDPVDAAARLLRRAGGRLSLDRLAARTGLSERQWRRRFELQTGVAPKLYARIARLDGALALRRARPDLSWSELAVAGGYFDQSHLLRDSRELLGCTPAAWLGG